MEFIQYLSPAHMRVYELATKVAKVRENPPVCRKHDIFGFFSTKTRELAICTSKIKIFGNLARNVEATLLHEGAHIAHGCKGRFRGLEAFGIDRNKLVLSWEQENDLKKVIAFDQRLKHVDREAFWMEDKPDQVAYVIKKYCGIGSNSLFKF